MKYSREIKIGSLTISEKHPTVFIADLAANHDGDLTRAKELIYLAKEAGADVAKFQHFLAPKIVSDYGFKKLKGAMAHQKNWDKSVFEIYKQYECNREWTSELVATAKKAGILFMSTPYDTEAVALLNPHIPAYKIGSGDVTWIEFIEFVAKKKKPVLIATGASSMEDVERAVSAILKHNPACVLMQCNTNYTANPKNFEYIHLNVLKTFAARYPGMPLGLSDHTPEHASVLGAIALGARVIEKHFTDDNGRKGPDHLFSMNPKTWKEMVLRSRELEAALGGVVKKIEVNEKDSIIVQRRCLRFTKNKNAGEKIEASDLEALRPSPEKAVAPYRLKEVVGKKLKKNKEAGDALYSADWEAK